METKTATKTPHDLTRPIEDLLRDTPAQDMVQLHQDLHRLCDNLQAQGLDVPERLLRLDKQLQEAAIEAQFDNMPI